MKYFLLIGAFFIGSKAFCQKTDLKEVFQQHTEIDNIRFYSIQFINKDTFMIHATKGTTVDNYTNVQVTFDQGENFIGYKRPIGNYGELMRTHFYINYYNDKINLLSLKDNKFTEITSQPSGVIRNLSVHDDAILVYIGSTLYASYDTCKTWQATNSNLPINNTPIAYKKDSILLFNKLATPSSNKFISHLSTDHGLSWATKEHNLLENYYAEAFGCINSSEYYYINEDFTNLNWSSDGGDFFPINYPISDFNAKFINALVFANRSIGYVIVNGFDLYKTLDGGQNWVLKYTFQSNEPIYNIHAVNENIVFFLAYNTNNNNVIYVTHNGLETITEINVPTNPTIELFPNPARQSVAIQFTGAETARLRVINYTGQVVISQNQFSSGNLSIEQLPAGIYLVELEVNGAFVREKLVVER